LRRGGSVLLPRKIQSCIKKQGGTSESKEGDETQADHKQQGDDANYAHDDLKQIDFRTHCTAPDLNLDVFNIGETVSAS
jgi:hypothetical protein